MTTRFGKSYGTASERSEPLVPTPVGIDCMYFRCGATIELDDDGFILPWGKDGYILHSDCYLFSIGVIAHGCDFQTGQADQCDFEWKHDKNRDPFARFVI